jgi:hypothetical protein
MMGPALLLAAEPLATGRLVPMTMIQITQQRKRLQDAWRDLEQVSDELNATAENARRKLRAAFEALLAVDKALGDLEGGAA